MQLRLVTFRPADTFAPAEWHPGALVDDRVYDLAALAEGAEGLRCVACILASEQALNTARTLVEKAVASGAVGGVVWPLSEVELTAPIPRPGKLLALAGNYAAHIMESTSKKLQGTGVTKSDVATPRIFMKPPANTVCGPGAPIVISQGAQFVDWEAEMGIVIGSPGKHIPRERGLEHVGGITIVNDVSERELKIWERPEDREWDKFFDWLNGKWGDSFAPMGPCVVPLSDIGDIDRLSIKLWVNGELKQDANTGQMIFKAEDIIEYASSICTLHTGDVIATGTPSGVGHAQGIRLKPGDVVRIELEGVGVLENPVVAEE